MKDFHKETAAKLFRVPESTVTREQREFVKKLDFGTLYGASSATLMKNINFADIFGMPHEVIK